jgi:hypothetical protein
MYEIGETQNELAVFDFFLGWLLPCFGTPALPWLLLCS